MSDPSVDAAAQADEPRYELQPSTHGDDYTVWALDEFGCPDGDPLAIVVVESVGEQIVAALNAAGVLSERAASEDWEWTVSYSDTNAPGVDGYRLRRSYPAKDEADARRFAATIDGLRPIITKRTREVKAGQWVPVAALTEKEPVAAATPAPTQTAACHPSNETCESWGGPDCVPTAGNET